MKKPEKRPSAGLQVSASELAQMGICERFIVFEQRYGRRRTLAQQQAAKRGQHAHQRFYRNRHLDTAVNWDLATNASIRLVLYECLRQAVRVSLRPIHWCIARWRKNRGWGDGS